MAPVMFSIYLLFIDTTFINRIVYLPKEINIFRWIMKAENGVSNIADEVKLKLRSIANSTSHEEAKASVEEFLDWKNCRGKLRTWFLGMKV